MSTYNTEDSPDSLAVGDFNGDLRDDIAVSHANSQSIALYQQEEDGTFAEAISVDVRSGGFNVLASGDLNSDGLDDLVLLRGAGPSDEQLAIFYQANGGLSNPVLRTVDDDTYLSYGIAVGDMTGDGRDDIVVSAGGNSAHASLNLFVQQPDGTVATEATTYDTSHLPKAVAIGDVNHDGRNDLLVVHAAWQSLSLYSQSETGTLNAAVAYDLPYTDDYRPHALALADVTDDGGLDVLLANHSTFPEENGLVVLSNTSNAPTSRITSPYPSLDVTESTSILIEGTTSTNATTLEISTDGGQTWHSQSASPNWSYNWSTPSDGYHIILSRAIDAAGKVQSPPAQTRILVGEAGGELSACVTLQGRPTKPHSRWSVPLRVSLTIAGESTPTYTLTPTSDDNGCFTLPNIAAGTYEVRVKHAHTLQNVQTVTLGAGSNTVDLGTLREGDANDDNFVTIIDFSILAAAFGTCEGNPDYDPRADFNGDGCITILDFSLLASNFGQSGQSAPMTPNRGSEVSLSEVAIVIRARADKH